jgi:hypothetical protein
MKNEQLHPDQVVLTCRVERELYNQLLKIAGMKQVKTGNNITVSALVREALDHYAGKELNR